MPNPAWLIFDVRQKMAVATEKILSVERIDVIGKLGILVLPKILAAEYRGPTGSVVVVLRRPGGSELTAAAEITMPHVNPAPRELFYLCLLRNLREEDVPLGSEVWLSRENEQTA